jgi:hypothetical protein
MTQDEIIAMLRASCDKDKVDPEQNGFWVIHTPELEAFAKLVAQHEREKLQGQIETLYAMYELASKQRDYLMDQQSAQVAELRGKLQ